MKKKSKRKSKRSVNPWAVCTSTVGRRDKKKYERCVIDVKKKSGYRKNPEYGVFSFYESPRGTFSVELLTGGPYGREMSRKLGKVWKDKGRWTWAGRASTKSPPPKARTKDGAAEQLLKRKNAMARGKVEAMKAARAGGGGSYRRNAFDVISGLDLPARHPTVGDFSAKQRDILRSMVGKSAGTLMLLPTNALNLFHRMKLTTPRMSIKKSPKRGYVYAELSKYGVKIVKDLFPKMRTTRSKSLKRKSVRRNQFEAAERSVAMKTARARGAVGSKAIVPRVVAAVANKSDRILDFGAGKEPVHALSLRNQGFNVSFYDFNLPRSEVALTKKYNLVYASNVLNVQSGASMMAETLKQVWNVLTPTGRFIANFPSSPRKSKLKPDAVLFLLEKFFKGVCQVAGTTSAPVWMAQGKRKDAAKWAGKKGMRPNPGAPAWYLGMAGRKKSVFFSPAKPTKRTHGKFYDFVLGPFYSEKDAKDLRVKY